MASIISATTTNGLSTSADNSGSLQLATNNGTTAVTIDTSQNVGIGLTSPTSRLTVRTADGDGVSIQNAAGTAYRWAVNADNSFSCVNTGVAERMRITSDGMLLIGKTANDGGVAGFEARPSGLTLCTRNSDLPLYINRTGNDGTLVTFRQDNTEEGTISVSGTTVSYNGGHLARWSQLPNNSKDDTILKGTVMSNLDDMCVWTKDGTVLDNEQLNKMKVSDVEGDTNVAGVFVNWTRDEDCNSDDMNIAMTGDMIIRIAEGVVVQKGDLLMSAGDGTAKPQGDDIVRSKTIAKVTSNHVTCTYADGSYCVPCVLMAC